MSFEKQTHELVAQSHAALGALRQDVRAILAALGRLEEKVAQAAPGAAKSDFCGVPGCNCHVREFESADEPV